jgi:hypothetical protein
MSRSEDIAIISSVMKKAETDLAKLFIIMKSEGSFQRDINLAADKALDSLDALKGVVKIVKVK